MIRNDHFPLTVICLLLLVQACTDDSERFPYEAQQSGTSVLERAARQDGYVATEVDPLKDDEVYPMETTEHRHRPAEPARTLKVVRKVKIVERSSSLLHSTDSTAVVQLTSGISGEVVIHHNPKGDTVSPKRTFRKPVAETFLRNILLTKRTGWDLDDEHELHGSVSGLAVNCETSTGSFVLTTPTGARNILVTPQTEFEDKPCTSLRNGDRVEVKTGDLSTDSIGNTGWIARTIEFDDDDHALWKPTALSLLEGGTAVRLASITELRIAFSDTGMITIRSPLEFFFHYKKYRPFFHFVHRWYPVRVTAIVESSRPDPEIVIARRNAAISGSVPLKRQFSLTAEDTTGGVIRRTYELTMHPHDHSGDFHSMIEVWTHESLYDSTAAVSTHVWGIPYKVHK